VLGANDVREGRGEHCGFDILSAKEFLQRQPSKRYLVSFSMLFEKIRADLNINNYQYVKTTRENWKIVGGPYYISQLTNKVVPLLNNRISWQE